MGYKKLLKTLITNAISIDINLIKERIKNFEYVSFDIFDTLIKRDVVNINDVFSLVEKKYNDLYISESINGFKKLRINSEKMAIKNNPSVEEINIDQIYDELGVFDKKTKDRLKTIECSTEIGVCTQHKALHELFQWCIQNGKKVIIISDMYLDTNTVKTILNKNDYLNYHNLYLSSEIGYKKSSGNLFQYVLEDLKISPKQLIHIGDNIKSDYLQARQKKIQSILIPTHLNYRKYNFSNRLEGKEKKNYNKIKNFINNRVNPTWDNYYSFGYEIFGPILLGFTNWLNNNLKSQGYNKVFFFSRDGYIMKKAFDHLFPASPIESKYLYVSRRSIRVPLISKDPSFENVIDLVVGKKYFDLKYFFINIGLEIDNYRDHLTKMNINPNNVISKKEFLTNDKYRQLFQVIQKEMVLNSNAELNNLTGYLIQEGFNENVAIVDIGWRGTMQTSLSSIYPELNIYGYYMGLSSSTFNKKNMHGYLFSPIKTDDDYCEIYNSFVGLFEMLFLALEGSTKKYTYLENKYKPVLMEYEFPLDSIEIQRLRCIQSGALSFIKDIQESSFDSKLFTNREVYTDLLMFGRKPKNKCVNIFGDFVYYDSQKGYLAKPDNFWRYFLNIKKFKKEFSESSWKIGFLKRLLKVNMPYDKIYDFLRKTL